ncbi:MAG: family transposase [Proteobacteria bacterium]|nr:family transposase [Pseudomonadota bacterium]
MMDEFALFKGHRYATVVADADTQQVLWVGEGRSRAALRPFFTWLGPEGCTAIESVAMDMDTAFDLEVREHCPQAKVVYDLFHVVAKFGREVIDRVRVDQANQLRDNPKSRQVIKRSRWLLLRNPENLPEGHDVRLSELLTGSALEKLVIDFSLRNPHLGQAQVSRQMNDRYSADISPNGVRYIWLRENMNTMALRLAKVESLSNTAKDFA